MKLPPYPQNSIIGERIHRLRRLILVHSILYYVLDSSIVSDFTFDSWSQELVGLQNIHPEISKRVPYMRKAFADFDGSTGAFLPLMDTQAYYLALRLLRLAESHKIQRV